MKKNKLEMMEEKLLKLETEMYLLSIEVEKERKKMIERHCEENKKSEE